MCTFLIRLTRPGIRRELSEQYIRFSSSRSKRLIHLGVPSNPFPVRSRELEDDNFSIFPDNQRLSPSTFELRHSRSFCHADSTPSRSTVISCALLQIYFFRPLPPFEAFIFLVPSTRLLLPFDLETERFRDIRSL